MVFRNKTVLNTAARIIPMLLGHMARERHATDMDMVCKIYHMMLPFFQ